MFKNTRAAFAEVLCDLRRFTFICGIVANVLPIVYLIYAIVASAGFLVINIALLVPSMIYLIYYILVHGYGYNVSKQTKRITKHTMTWYKLVIRLFNAVIIIYSIYATSTHVTVWSVVLAAFTVITLAFQIIMELLVIYAEYQFDRVVDGMRRDADAIMKPVNAVKGILGKFAGDEKDAPDDDLDSTVPVGDEKRFKFGFFTKK